MLKAGGQFFDGESARAHDVDVVLIDERLTITGPAIGSERRWPLESVEAVETPAPDHPLRLRSAGAPGERLVIADRALIAALLPLAPQLTRSLDPRKMLRFAAIIIAGLLLVVLLGYALLSLLPPAVARLMPETWRERLGRQAEQSFIGSYSECKSGEGSRALAALGYRLFENNADLAPDFTLRVYRLPVINAFTLPGGRIILSGKLIEAAKDPEELAGVLAHELGHVDSRDPEVALVRLTGLQLLISLATGSDGGSILSNLAGLATLLRYTRAAEIRADDYAQMLLNRAQIDPLGLKRFFESVKKLEEARKPVGPLGGLLSTHPATDERVARIRPLENGPARPVMNGELWRALKAICKG
jgi:Zn-dependent protease with chaperone function